MWCRGFTVTCSYLRLSVRHFRFQHGGMMNPPILGPAKFSVKRGRRGRNRQWLRASSGSIYAGSHLLTISFIERQLWVGARGHPIREFRVCLGHLLHATAYRAREQGKLYREHGSVPVIQHETCRCLNNSRKCARLIE